MNLDAIKIDKEYLITQLINLLNIPSPTGFTHRAAEHLHARLAEFDSLKLKRTPKDALLVEWPGEKGLPPRALTAHVDTLGAMVKEIKSNGCLILSRIGSYAWNTVEGEGLTVFTSQDSGIRGSLLVTAASRHVYGFKTDKMKRKEGNMEVRLDAVTSSADETRQLGVSVGDFVAFDPRVEVNNGFVRSRHLDDKASVACVLASVKALQDAGLRPARTTYLLFSNYEEVGHGATFGLPPDLAEFVAVDMAAVGEGQTSDEYHVTVCVKDSGGPYDHVLSRRLIDLADKNDIPYKVDIYPYYGSDGGAYWRSGGPARVALVGPGVDASHNYERTHEDALVATTRLLASYLLTE